MRALAVCLALIWAGVVHAAGLSFEETVQDVRLKPDAEQVDVAFPFENKTNQPVTIKRIEKSCASCLQATVDGNKMAYQPGEKGVVRLTFGAGTYSGTVEKSTIIWIETASSPASAIELKVRLHIPELLRMEPKTTVWFLGDKPETRTITLKVDHDQPIRITAISASSEMFKAELRTIKDGAEYEVLLTPAQTERPAIGIVRIQTDCPVKRHQQIQAFGVVRAKVPAGRETSP